MEKRLSINKNRVMILNINESVISICEYFAKNGVLSKTYNLSCFEDYGFSAFLSNDDKKVSFDFSLSHPLYFPLLHFLGDDNEVIIDDDRTREVKEKFLRVYKNNNKICIDFVNSKEDIFDRFNVVVNDVAYDCSSKIDSSGLDTKKRLNKFFKEVVNSLLEQNHQITLEEYMTKKKVLKK